MIDLRLSAGARAYHTIMNELEVAAQQLAEQDAQDLPALSAECLQIIHACPGTFRDIVREFAFAQAIRQAHCPIDKP
jgi:hypothetical protein